MRAPETWKILEVLTNPGRDSTALTIYEIDAATLADPIIRAPTYKTIYRKQWTGTKHTHLYARIKALADQWQPRYIAIDATGVGAGLTSFLDKAYPGKVIPYIFNAATKSKLGWGFLAAIDSGRYKEYAATRS